MSSLHAEWGHRGPALHDANEGEFGYAAPRAEGCPWMVNGFTPRGVLVRFFRPTVGAVLNLAARIRFYNGVRLTGLFGPTRSGTRCLLSGADLEELLGVYDPRRRFSSCLALVRLDYEIVDVEAVDYDILPYRATMMLSRKGVALALAAMFVNGFYVAREDVAEAVATMRGARGVRCTRSWWAPEYWRLRNALREYVDDLDACRAALEATKFEVPYLGTHPGYSREAQ